MIRGTWRNTIIPLGLLRRCVACGRRPLTTRAPAAAPKPHDLRSQLPLTALPLAANPAPPATALLRKRRSLRPYIYGVACVLIGTLAGSFVAAVIAPPTPPVPGSLTDNRMIEHLDAQAAALPVFQSLDSDPCWVSDDMVRSTPLGGGRLFAGPLAGARGLGGCQRVFTHTETGDMILILWIGPAVAGWPGVTHGGLIGTLLLEALNYSALRLASTRSGFRTSHALDLSELSLNYRKPVLTNNFYVVRTTSSNDAGFEASPRKLRVSGTLETLEGTVCVEASGYMVIPER